MQATGRGFDPLQVHDMGALTKYKEEAKKLKIERDELLEKSKEQERLLDGYRLLTTADIGESLLIIQRNFKEAFPQEWEMIADREFIMSLREKYACHRW